MARRARYWVCDRRSEGVKCATRNENRLKKCTACGKLRPAVKKPKHMQSLNPSLITYEDYIELNGGEFCGICGITRAQTKDPSRRMNRDHGHGVFGAPRGLLCTPCNRRFVHWMTAEWLEAAAAYDRRTRERAAA